MKDSKQLTSTHQKMPIMILRLLASIGLALGLIHFTLKFTEGDLWSEIYQAKKTVLFVALLFHGAILGIIGYRWNLLLRVQGICLSAWELVRLVMIGVCFNFVIPGAVGGDLLKTILVTQQAKGKEAEAVLTVILDRALGLLGLFIVASVVVLFYFPFLLNLEKEYRPIQIAAFTVGLGSIAGVFVIAMVELHGTITRICWIARVISFGARRLPASVVSTLTRLANALELYRRDRASIVMAIVLSVLVHSCLAINLFLVGTSVGEGVLRLSDYFLASPVANAVAAIPVTPAGIGTRDAIIAMFLSALQAPAGKSGVIPVTMTLIILFWAVTGGMIFVFSKVPKVSAFSSRASRYKDSRLYNR